MSTKPLSIDELEPVPAEESPATANVEGEIREFVRRDVAGVRRLPHVDDFSTANLSAMIERVGGTSIKEIDHLIEELSLVREYLQVEGERVQRQAANYAQVSQAALASAKIILDSMGQWKTAVGALRDRN